MRQLVITVAPSRFDVSLTLLCPPALILSRSLQHPYISSLSFHLRPLLLTLSRALRSSLLHPLLLTPLSLSLRFFTPIHTTSPSATSSPSHQNGSRRSGRSSNTPACGSRRVCPSAASTLAGDSSSRSFECLRPFSFSLSLIHSLSLSYFPCLSCSLLLPLFLAPTLLALSSPPVSRVSSSRTAFTTAIALLDSEWIRRVTDQTAGQTEHTVAARRSSFVVLFVNTAFASLTPAAYSGMDLRQIRESRPRTG